MERFCPKIDGVRNMEFFRSPEILQELEKVREWLQKNCNEVI